MLISLFKKYLSDGKKSHRFDQLVESMGYIHVIQIRNTTNFNRHQRPEWRLTKNIVLPNNLLPSAIFRFRCGSARVEQHKETHTDQLQWLFSDSVSRVEYNCVFVIAFIFVRLSSIRKKKLEQMYDSFNGQNSNKQIWALVPHRSRHTDTHSHWRREMWKQQRAKKFHNITPSKKKWVASLRPQHTQNV